MIEERARVVQVERGIAEIVTQRQGACGSCTAQGGCGTSLLAAWFPQRHLTFHLKNDIGAQSGDTVIIGLDEGLLQRGSLTLYLLPLAGLLAGAILGEQLFDRWAWSSELGAVLIGLLGLSAALRLSGRLAHAEAATGEGSIRLLRVVGRPPAIAAHDISMPQVHLPESFRKHE